MIVPTTPALPVYDHAVDGNVFAWLAAQAEPIRRQRSYAMADQRQIRMILQTQTATNRPSLGLLPSGTGSDPAGGGQTPAARDAMTSTAHLSRVGAVGAGNTTYSVSSQKTRVLTAFNTTSSV